MVVDLSVHSFKAFSHDAYLHVLVFAKREYLSLTLWWPTAEAVKTLED